MALISCELFSESLMRATTITVVLPQATEEQIGLIDKPLDGPPPVLYLLHGLSDDHTAWQRYTSIERYAAARGLAVVMPAVDRSFYANEAHGHRYWDWVSEELPASSASSSTSPRPARTPSSPASRWAATARSSWRSPIPTGTPRRPRSRASRTRSLVEDLPTGPRSWSRVFDGEITPADDIFALLESADRPTLTELYVGCGTEEGCSLARNRFAGRGAGPRRSTSTIDFRPGDHVVVPVGRPDPGRIAWLPSGRRA